MLINKDQVNLIKENKVCYIKNFASLEREYDFNLISSLLEENYIIDIRHTEMDINSIESTKHNICNLRDIFQIRNITDSLKEFRTFLNFFEKMFKYSFDEKNQVDLFISLISKTGTPHRDREDVFILGLNGKTIYKIFDTENKNYEINKGDLIFIPKGIKHKVISITPRIIASIGFFSKRNI